MYHEPPLSQSVARPNRIHNPQSRTNYWPHLAHTPLVIEIGGHYLEDYVIPSSGELCFVDGKVKECLSYKHLHDNNSSKKREEVN